MKYIKLLIIFSFLFLISCSPKYREIIPLSNVNNIKVKLEIASSKHKDGQRDEFTLKLTNMGDRDLGRCTLKLDDKYEHQLEGLINKTEDWEGKPQTSLLPAGESQFIVFNKDLDNYSIFGITDKEYRVPETIELNCLDGQVVWKTK